MTKQTKILTGVLASAALGALVILFMNKENKAKINSWFNGLCGSQKQKYGYLEMEDEPSSGTWI